MPAENDNIAIDRAGAWPDRAVIHPFVGANGRRGFSMWCPGCNAIHAVNTAGAEPVWKFSGCAFRPTFTPSIRVRWQDDGKPLCCHSFIQNGEWKFLPDCTHDLAGQTVRMVPDPTRVKERSADAR